MIITSACSRGINYDIDVWLCLLCICLNGFQANISALTLYHCVAATSWARFLVVGWYNLSAQTWLCAVMWFGAVMVLVGLGVLCTYFAAVFAIILHVLVLCLALIVQSHGLMTFLPLQKKFTARFFWYIFLPVFLSS